MEELLDRSTNYTVSKSEVKAFFTNVYSYMFVALGISGLVSFYMASSGVFIQWFGTEDGGYNLYYYLLLFSPIGMVLYIQNKLKSLSMMSLVGAYVLYATLIGMVLSTLFFRYGLGELGSTFLITAGAFAAMAILGYTTSVDLSKMGSLLYMAFIGIFIASIVNLFLGSEPLAYLVSIIGVFVFTGLTAWEMQKLKQVVADPELAGEERQKRSLIGGLMLYILFVNLFLSLLHLLGGRD